jgi:uncharacterized integral membrane protein (TIGR00698 family)
MAVAAAMPKGSLRDDMLARTIAGITVAGTVAMFALPAVGQYLGLSPSMLGAFLGGSIHEVAQAAASGFAVSDEVGKAATVVKMLRVACMGAVVAGVGLFLCRAPEGGKRAPMLPMFLVAFVGLAALSSMGLVPPLLKEAALELSRWCLLIAIAALGIRTSFATLLSGGGRPLLAIFANSLILMLLMLGGVLLIGG